MNPRQARPARRNAVAATPVVSAADDVRTDLFPRPQCQKGPPVQPSDRRMTVPKFMALKGAGRKIAMLTAYDYPTARLLDSVGLDAILVGDTLGMVIQGHPNTLPVTLDQMIYHAEIVGRAVRHALVIVDLPFPCCHLGPLKAVASAARVLKETRAQAVKLEGGAEQAAVIAALVAAGIPVMGHCGLRPQSVHQLGEYRVQRDAQQLLADARAVRAAGAFAIVLECIPADLARQITRELDVPTIGIGAGADCDGQVLVIHDMLGLTAEQPPRHVRKFADLKTGVVQAVTAYRDEVRNGTFPGPEQTFH
jgi:3-methyl-2-oxobutanoate hydroxymethyltransferase